MITHNRIDLLKRCVESILSQSYKNIELIIVDDCSKDGTKDYLSCLERNEDKVTVFFNKENMGACRSRNIAIDFATGEYITGCDDDDFFDDNRISTFLKYKDKLNEFSFLTSRNYYLLTSGRKIPIPFKVIPKYITSEDLIFYNMVGNQIFTKTSLLKSYKFNVAMPAWQDLDCWYKILYGENKKAYRIDECTYIQDMSHDSARITDKKYNSILRARDLFIESNQLNKKQSSALNNHLRSYEEYKSLRLGPIISMFSMKLSVFTILITCFYIIKYIKIKFKGH